MDGAGDGRGIGDRRDGGFVLCGCDFCDDGIIYQEPFCYITCFGAEVFIIPSLIDNIDVENLRLKRNGISLI